MTDRQTDSAQWQYIFMMSNLTPKYFIQILNMKNTIFGKNYLFLLSLIRLARRTRRFISSPSPPSLAWRATFQNNNIKFAFLKTLMTQAQAD